MHIKEFENLPKDKENKVIKLVKADIRTRLCVETSADGVFIEYCHLFHALGEPQHDPKSGNIKGLLKEMDKIKFLLTVYILKSTTLGKSFETGELYFSCHLDSFMGITPLIMLN